MMSSNNIRKYMVLRLFGSTDNFIIIRIISYNIHRNTVLYDIVYIYRDWYEKMRFIENPIEENNDDDVLVSNLDIIFQSDDLEKCVEYANILIDSIKYNL